VPQPRWWEGIIAPTAYALVFYDSRRLYLSYQTSSKDFKPPAGLTENGAAWASEHNMPPGMRSVLNDDRMEAFLWPTATRTGKGEGGPYFAFEVNRGGRAVVSSTRFLRQFDFQWRTARCASKVAEAEAAAAAAAAAAATSVEANDSATAAAAAAAAAVADAQADQVVTTVNADEHGRIVLTFEVEFSDLGVTAAELEAGTRTLRAGLYRAFRDDATGAAMAWGSWVDPGDDQVDFHRPQTFGRIHFAGRQ
jgi:hypothetical protein